MRVCKPKGARKRIQAGRQALQAKDSIVSSPILSDIISRNNHSSLLGGVDGRRNICSCSFVELAMPSRKRRKRVEPKTDFIGSYKRMCSRSRSSEYGLARRIGLRSPDFLLCDGTIRRLTGSLYRSQSLSLRPFPLLFSDGLQGSGLKCIVVLLCTGPTIDRRK